jgi:hypothetical protein
MDSNSNNNNEDLDHWYDEIDPTKSPDDIFWEETERQQRAMDGGNSIISSPYAGMSSTGISSTFPNM